jgi:hypothetical protein
VPCQTHRLPVKSHSSPLSVVSGVGHLQSIGYLEFDWAESQVPTSAVGRKLWGCGRCGSDGPWYFPNPAAAAPPLLPLSKITDSKIGWKWQD